MVQFTDNHSWSKARDTHADDMMESTTTESQGASEMSSENDDNQEDSDLQNSLTRTILKLEEIDKNLYR